MLCQAPWEQARHQGYRRGGGAGGGLLGKRGFTLGSADGTRRPSKRVSFNNSNSC